MRLFPEVQSVRAGLISPGRQPADLGAAGKRIVEPHQHVLTLHAERIGQQEELGVVLGGNTYQVLPHVRRSIPVRQVGIVDVECRHVGLRQHRGRDRKAGTVLHFSTGSDDPSA